MVGIYADVGLSRFELPSFASEAKTLSIELQTRKGWAWADSNCQLLAYQANTLPLSHRPLVLRIGVEGLEPSHGGSKDRCLTTWLYSSMYINNLQRGKRGNRTPVARFGV